MISFQDLELSGIGLLEALVAAGILFLLFVLIRRLLLVVVPRGTYRIVFRRVFPVAESVIWIWFSVWALGLVFVDPTSQTLAVWTLLAVGVLWLSWFAAKDFVAGLILRLQDDYSEDQVIRLGEIEGRILRVGYLGIDLEQANGAIIRLPYGKLTGEIHSRSQPATSDYCRFTIDVPKGRSLEETVDRVRESALMSPWTSSQGQPEIRRLSETPAQYSFEVIVHGIGPGQSEAIERDVRSYLGL